MKLHGKDLDKADLWGRVGNTRQAGGIQLLSYEEGHERGARVLQVETGSGFRFGILVDRGMDVGFCDFGGASLTWIPPKGFVAPSYFEGDEYGWLRISGLGGLFNTCGLVTMGNPQTLDVSHYQYNNRTTDYYGIHDRIGITPSARFTYGEGWDGDRYILWIEGLVRQEIEYGENLTLRRRYETELGANSFTVRDTVTNEGPYETPHQILYHVNAGWPIVDDGAELITELAGPPPTVMFGTDDTDPDRFRRFVSPGRNVQAQGYELDLASNADGLAQVAVVNRGFNNGQGLGLFLQYNTSMLPTFVEWRMMAEQLYAVGIEPASNPFGSVPELIDAGHPVMLQPGEQRHYELQLGALPDIAAIDRFAAGKGER